MLLMVCISGLMKVKVLLVIFYGIFPLTLTSDVEATKIGDHNVVEAKGLFIFTSFIFLFILSLNFNVMCSHRGSIYIHAHVCIEQFM